MIPAPCNQLSRIVLALRRLGHPGLTHMRVMASHEKLGLGYSAADVDLCGCRKWFEGCGVRAMRDGKVASVLSYTLRVLTARQAWQGIYRVKQTQRSHPPLGNMSQERLQLCHIDVCGPMLLESTGGLCGT